MSGGGSSSHRTSGVKGLAEGAGEINALTPKGNFGDRPHQNADTGCTKAGTAPAHVVVQHNGWSYVVGPRADGGPWRYQWEAQEHADELNASPTRGGSHG